MHHSKGITKKRYTDFELVDRWMPVLLITEVGKMNNLLLRFLVSGFSFTINMHFKHKDEHNGRMNDHEHNKLANRKVSRIPFHLDLTNIIFELATYMLYDFLFVILFLGLD